MSDSPCNTSSEAGVVQIRVYDVDASFAKQLRQAPDDERPGTPPRSKMHHFRA